MSKDTPEFNWVRRGWGFIGIIEEKEELEHGLSEVLTMANKIIVDVSVKIGKLSERLGRIMIKHGKIDHMATGLFPWVREYTAAKEATIQAYNEIVSTHKDTMDFCSSKSIYPSQVIMIDFANSIAEFSKLKIKLTVLDDVLMGLLENIWDDVHFEVTQKEQLEKIMKDNIEKTNELPMYG